MKDEIKEILNKLLEYFKESNINNFGYEQDKLISYEEAQIILDYITNLQEENENLHIQLEDKANEQIKTMYLEYKSRNEKAIEYIKQHTEERVYKEPYNIDGFPDRIEYFIKGKWDLLDILQGEDKDE